MQLSAVKAVILSSLMVTGAVLGSGCTGAENPDAANLGPAGTTKPSETRTPATVGSLLPLEERARRAGVSLAQAEAWERSGVHIANSGSVYSEDCPIGGKVKIPTGVVVRC